MKKNIVVLYISRRIMDKNFVWNIIDKHFAENPQSLVRHHVESFDDFYKHSIYKIFKEKNPITIVSKYDESIGEYRSKCNMYIGGKNGDRIHFAKPVIYDSNSHYMFPNEARLRNMTYAMTIHVDVDLEFKGKAENETAVDVATGQTVMRVNPKFYRPAEVELLIGNPAKAKAILGWEPQTTLEQLCGMMVQADLKRNVSGHSF